MAQKHDPNETKRRGEQWYRKLKPKLEPRLNGKVIVIAIDSGLYVLGDDVYEADKAFDHFIGKNVKGYGRKIGPDPYTQRVSE
ncbi:MAG: hypothetical protein WAZ27_04900 [Minisyncoccia bacterium]